MKRAFAVLAVFLAAALPLGASAASVQKLEGRLLVGFNRGVPVEQRLAVVAQMGGRVLGRIDSLGIVLAEPGLRPSSAFLRDMAVHPEVAAVDYDFTTNWLLDQPNLMDPRFPELQEAFRDLRRPEAPSRPWDEAPKNPSDEAPWGVKRVNAPAVWSRTQGEGVKVAVIDTGIDPNNPEFAGRIAGGYNALDKSENWADDHFHGTHVAGTIAAALDGKGVVGVAPKTSLYAVKVLNKDGSGSLYGILEGMGWCVDHGIQVANMSLGAPQGNQALAQAVKALADAGVTLVAAAGNSGGTVSYPAAYPEAIAVSASDSNDRIAKFSSRGRQVAFIAPGVQIPSTVPGGAIQAYSGTSMASPHVAGLAALAVSLGASGPEAVRSALKAAASPLPGLSEEQQGAGMIDAAKLAR